MVTKPSELTESQRAIIWRIVVAAFVLWVIYAFASKRARKLPVVRSLARRY